MLWSRWVGRLLSLLPALILAGLWMAWGSAVGSVPWYGLVLFAAALVVGTALVAILVADAWRHE